MGIVRAEVIARMSKAFKEGVSATRFYWDMRAIGLAYRKTDMLADWSDVNELVRKEGLARYVRKGYIPGEYAAIIHEWAMSKEFMYQVRCQKTFAGVPEDEPTFVNIMSDTPMTIEAIEQEAWERSFAQSPPKETEERKFVVETAIHRAEE